MRFPKIILLIPIFFCQTALAQISISEIMYDVSGSDSGREWVEITNGGIDSVTVATSTWKFFEDGTNHNLSLFQGSVVIPAGGFAVIADNPAKFLADWPQFGGTIFDSVFSLGNTGEAVAIKSDTSTVVDEVAYVSSAGGAGDGNSLQKVSGAWTALAPTPGAVNQNGQNQDSEGREGNFPVATTTTDTTSDEDNSSSVSISSSDSGKTNWPVEPQIISRIVGPYVAIAGADVVFKGEAVGLDKKPIKNIRYLWNFGDGSTKEGESVMHAYNFPADYVVILEVSSGYLEGSSRVRIKIISADIVISEVVAGFGGKIELVNNTPQELDLSWWRIRSGNHFFTLPKNTKMLSAGRLPLSAAVMGFPVSDMDVALLYPNGSLAYQFIKSVSKPIDIVPAISNDTSKSAEMPAVSSSKVSSAPVLREISENFNQAATVALAVPVEAETEVSGEDVSQYAAKPSSTLWFYGAGGIILLGLALVLFPRQTAVKNPADEYEIIE